MTIKVYADRIEIGNKTITTTPTGIRIGDSLAANTQQQGYVSQANFTARELALNVFSYQGSVSGYAAAGFDGSNLNLIEKFPFGTDTNATDVGDLTVARRSMGPVGQKSSTNGYVAGGQEPATSNVIDKYPYSSDSNATDVGDLTSTRSPTAAQSSSTHGYSGLSTVVDKFPFATDTNATLTTVTTTKTGSGPSGQSSTTHGYFSAGGDPGGNSNVIEKFPFASEGAATDVGDLTLARRSAAAQSSVTHGYNAGGYAPGSGPLGGDNTIDKFSFATDGNATDVGDLTTNHRELAGQSSFVSGYRTGGTTTNTIDKFPFSTDTNASDVGDLIVANRLLCGTQF